MKAGNPRLAEPDDDDRRRVRAVRIEIPHRGGIRDTVEASRLVTAAAGGAATETGGAPRRSPSDRPVVG
jgi:hypothetical protein